jgi:hypothetical protein
MVSKWVIFMIIFFLLSIIGVLITQLEKRSVQANWAKRRCDWLVMGLAGSFQPDSDSRPSAEFAKENFEFCMQPYVDQYMKLMMSPVEAMFSKNASTTNTAFTGVQSLRNIAQKLFNVFSSYLDGFYKKFVKGMFEFSRIIQYVKMAMDRVTTMMLSVLYAGITAFRAMLNTIQFVIKVVLIICTLLIVLLILLWFILFPVIPLVLAALAIIMHTSLKISEVVGGGVGDRAQEMRGSFCFIGETRIYTKSGYKLMKDIKIGDDLGKYGMVTATMKMDGSESHMYELDGIYVSGSHLVKNREKWHMVSEDERAVSIDTKWNIVYCLNTTSNNIPVWNKGEKEIIIFRDWEEIPNDDTIGQCLWTAIISHHLNPRRLIEWGNIYAKENEATLFLMGYGVFVQTPSGWKTVKEITMDEELCDRNGKSQRVWGIVEGMVDSKTDNDDWHTEAYEWIGNEWIRGQTTISCDVSDKSFGRSFITEKGEIVILENGVKKVVRDFTEIGHDAIDQMYPFVKARLRMS